MDTTTDFNRINVIGLGYIGLPTALMLAAHGARVTGTDCSASLVDKLNAGMLTFEEKGLAGLFFAAQSKGIRFSTEYQQAEIYIVAVPTPYLKDCRKIDPTYVISAVRSVFAIAPEGAILVVESTISPGTVDTHIRPAAEEMGRRDIRLVHAPERIIPGNMIRELVENSRTIGADDSAAAETVKAEYARFCRGEIVLTDIRSAEMTKVVENTYRDINIAFANELARICRRNHLNVYEIIRIANKHPRVNILQPGPGVGGHCISVDPWFLVGDYPDLVNIILAARNINDDQPEYVLRRIRDVMKVKGLRDVSRVGIYGITYKEDVDDTRESPALQLLEKMEEHLAYGISLYDPFVKRKVADGQYFDFDEFLGAVDMVVILVAHSHLRENFDKIKDKIILDTRGITKFDEDRIFSL